MATTHKPEQNVLQNARNFVESLTSEVKLTTDNKSPSALRKQLTRKRKQHLRKIHS